MTFDDAEERAAFVAELLRVADAFENTTTGVPRLVQTLRAFYRTDE